MSPLPRLFIDTLELTIAVEEQRQQDVQERLTDAERWSDILAESASRGRYRYRYELVTPSGNVIAINARPMTHTANYLKLEYSPEKVGPEGAALIADYLGFVLGSNYREAFYQGTVGRLDATFDVRRVPLENYLIEDMRPSKKTALIAGEERNLETIYLGFKARRQFCIYDKRAEVESRNETASTRTSWVRFEYRYNTGDYPLGDLYRRMNNPYDRIIIRRYAPLRDLMPDVQARLLFDACRLRGKSGVLSSIPEDDRAAVKAAIESFPYATIWRRRRAIWVQLRDRIEELLPVDHCASI
jgi:replication initiation factor